jgi:hypothetical protein
VGQNPSVKVLEADLRQKCPTERNYEIEGLVAKLHKPSSGGWQSVPFIASNATSGWPWTLGASPLLFALPQKTVRKIGLRKNPALAGTLLELPSDSDLAWSNQ